jgi:molybdenum cofactor guanylyltransferase
MKISAVLLTGGESRRIGKDKASLLFGGKPLWQIQLDLLRKTEPTEILISARTDPKWRPSDVQFVSDKNPSRGPLSGLTASLARIRTGHLLALAIDMPFMTKSYLCYLCDQAQPGRGVLPMIGERAEPLTAIYPTEVHCELVAALSGSEFSLQALTRQLVKAGKLRVLPVAKEEEKLFRNLNEPADFDSSQT